MTWMEFLRIAALSIIAVVLGAFAISFAWLSLRDKWRAREYKRRQAVPEMTPEMHFPGPVVPVPPIFRSKAMRDRFNDLDCRTDFNACQEARRLQERSEKAWLN